MEAKGFKAVWEFRWIPGTQTVGRVEYYPHIKKVYLVTPMQGSQELKTTPEAVRDVLGEPKWM